MGEGKCLVDQCCCGCSLKTGAMTIGIIYLVNYLCHVVWMLWITIADGADYYLFQFCIDLVQTIAACCLIHGVRTEHATLVLVFVFSTLALAILKAVALIVMAVEVFPLSWGYWVPVVVYIILDVYSVVVTRSYAHELRNPAPNPAQTLA